jgi:hypothetical protein
MRRKKELACKLRPDFLNIKSEGLDVKNWHKNVLAAFPHQNTVQDTRDGDK